MTKITFCFAGHEGVSKVKDMLDAIAPQLQKGMRVCFLTGVSGDPGRYDHPAIEVLRDCQIFCA